MTDNEHPEMKKAKTILLISALLLTFMSTKTINVMQDTKEVWKAVPGYDRYQISNTGFLKGPSGKILATQLRRGYPTFKTLDGKSYYVHRIVAEVFIPNPNNKKTVNHRNSIRNDNRVENLEWCTQKENIHHSYITGSKRDKVNRNILDGAIVLKIRDEYIPGRNGNLRELCERYGLKMGHLQKIVYRDIWKYV